MPLPARVRLTHPPLPLAPALKAAAARLCPEVPLETVQGVTLAIAGGKVIGAHLSWPGGQAVQVETGWRGRGLEEALLAARGTIGDGERRAGRSDTASD